MKKGFTLIELLAVILILGIIALIAIPSVTKIIEESKRGAFKTTVQNLMDAVEKDCTTKMLNNTENVKKYTIVDGKINPNVGIKGDLPDIGSIVLNDECLVIGADLYNDELAASFVDESIEIIDIEEAFKYNAGDIVYYDPIQNVKCTKKEADNNLNADKTKTGINTGCMKWYVIETDNDESKSTVDVLLDHNVVEKCVWDKGGNAGIGYEKAQIKVKVDSLVTEANWHVSTAPRLISADEVAKIVGADREDTLKWHSSKSYLESQTADININVNAFRLDGMKSSNKTSYSSTNGWKVWYANNTRQSEFAWLYNYTSNCTKYGCEIPESTSAGYWTNTPVIGKLIRAWIVSWTSELSSHYVGDSFHGIRPVITISKEVLKQY